MSHLTQALLGGAAGVLFRRLAAGFRDLLVPPACLICRGLPAGAVPGPEGENQRPAGICSVCWAGFSVLPETRCAVCGRPFQTGLEGAWACADCLISPPAFDRAAAGGLFNGSLRLAIHAFKYERVFGLARPLAGFMAERLAPPFYPPEADLILPVPLHRRRLRQRGFNQALLLARSLYAPWPERLHPDLLRRIRWTEPQINLTGPDRRRTVRRAFALTRPERVEGRQVLLVDDVFTTGATVNECARVLKRAGAETVLVLTLARVP
jgi:ComF family protein